MAINTEQTEFKINIPDELESLVLGISTACPKNHVITPDLEDNQKRWLIVGICLQSIVSPALRQYIEPVVINLYTQLKQSYRIDSQTFQNHLNSYGPANYRLNYEAINNNISIPKLNGRRNEQNYDYKVKNHVDFSKLFLVSSMAHYSAFDETCDLSALLGIIINIDKFTQIVQTNAITVRNVRNCWAHCNFDEWDTVQYQRSFQSVHLFIKLLLLNPADEAQILTNITKWEINGLLFLQGYSIGLDALKEIERITQSLAEYSLTMKSETESIFKHINDNLLHIKGQLTSACEAISRSDAEHDKTIEIISNELNIIKKTNNESEKTQILQMSDFKKTQSEFAEISKQVEDISVKQLSTTDRVSCIESKVEEMIEEISSIKKYTSFLKPCGKIFFYPPDRAECFVARHIELTRLKNTFITNKENTCTQVICGLGGCGKTTLSIEFAWSFQQLYPGGIFWMSAECSSALEDSIMTLAIDVATIGKDTKETTKRTLHWLSNLTERWLLVVDNVDEEFISNNVKEVLIGTWKRNTQGHLIITTRREQKEVESSIGVKDIFCVSLNTWDEDEATYFLKNRTGIKTQQEDEEIKLLVQELGGLPLALEQAAAHIKCIKCTFTEYTTRFKKKRLKLLQNAPALSIISKERLSIKTTWQLNMDYICQQSENEGLGVAAKTLMEIFFICRRYSKSAS